MLYTLPTMANSALTKSQNVAVNSDKADHIVPILTGNEFDLYVSKKPVTVNGKSSMAALINDSLPAPTLKMQEGDTVTIRVHNQMDESTSIHWHGLLVPFEMDGVPGISFDGIPANSTFTYKFKLKHQAPIGITHTVVSKSKPVCLVLSSLNPKAVSVIQSRKT